jgi:hypothetical protein
MENPVVSEPSIFHPLAYLNNCEYLSINSFSVPFKSSFLDFNMGGSVLIYMYYSHVNTHSFKISLKFDLKSYE